MTFFEIAAVVSPLASMVFAFVAFRRNQKNDDSLSAREMGEISTNVSYIKAQVDGINRKFEYADARHTLMAERLAAVEQSAKSAHHRIDTLARGVLASE